MRRIAAILWPTSVAAALAVGLVVRTPPGPTRELPAAPAPAADALLTPDDDAVVRAHEILASAMADGRWSRQDATALRAALGKLTPVQINEICSVLFSAVNSGELRIEYVGSVL